VNRPMSLGGLLARMARVAAASTWRCFACDTWNPDQAGTCMACGYDRYGWPTN